LKIRTFQPNDEVAQVEIYNAAVAALPGHKLATVADIRKRTSAPGFDPGTRFYAVAGSKVVGYCTLEPAQGRVSYPWCLSGFESVGSELMDAVVMAALSRGLNTLFAAYRRDWAPVIQFFTEHDFIHTRDIINYWNSAGDSPTVLNASEMAEPLKPTDIPAVAAMGKGLLRLPEEKLEKYFFANPNFSPSSVIVLRSKGTGVPYAVAIGLENPDYPDVRKIDPLAPCFRFGAFGTEGLNTKRVNGLFSLLVAEPGKAITAGLTLLATLTEEMTEGSVTTLAAQCPSDVKHLVLFYSRYFKEQGRFPILEKRLV